MIVLPYRIFNRAQNTTRELVTTQGKRRTAWVHAPAALNAEVSVRA